MSSTYSFFLFCFLLGVLSMLSSLVQATAIESLISPGDVIEGHKKYQNECIKCHDRFDRKKQKSKCLDCHKEVRDDLNKRIGYHGRKKAIHIQECSTCHTEHKGRKYDVVKLNKLTFDHQYTDFKLKGEHKKISCESCHKPKKKYREAPRDCYSCHKKDTPHKAKTMGKIAKRCDKCHSENNWREFHYKHKKSKFPHTGKHKKTECSACHIADRYIKTPKTCISCHKGDDSHRGRNGTQCQKCHTTKNWKTRGFNHDKHTDFPLRGQHKNQDCKSCHKKDPYKFKLKMACITCHKHDDSHKGRFGKKCQTCHNEKSWYKNRFDHNKKTKFKLRGKHATTTCTSCHKKNIYKVKLKKNCYSCHKTDDVHKGQQGKKCDKCHNEKGWRSKLRFDHDITKFPLVGLHSIVPCEECHLDNNYQDTSLKCNSCHKQDDVHKGTLGTNCQRCHNPNGWSIWRFEHNKESKFKLDGAHKKVHCHSCHVTAVSKVKSKPRNCLNCHRADDNHNGQFGPRCDRCHSTKDFKDVRMRR